MGRAPKKATAKKTAAPRRRRSKQQTAQPSAAATATILPGAAPAAASAPGTAPRAATGATSAYRAKVRMYRQGLGDCFLISLLRSDGSDRPFYLMIDCGVVLGTETPEDKMTAVMEDIVKVTNRQIDILAATHEHWDHLSGFNQAKASFDKLNVGQVWLAWTENPDDELTQKLKAQKKQALAALRMGLTHMELAGDSERAAELSGVLEFFGMAKGPTTGDALEIVRAKVKPKPPTYWTPGGTKDPVTPDGTSARFYFLGPPHDEKQLRRINPSARDKETYGLMDGLGMFMDGVAAAFDANDAARPFDRQYEIPFAVAQAAPELQFFRDHYFQPGEAADSWRRIDGDWLDGAADLALQLDSLTNNTSLVIAIELAPGGDVLLFAADAQVGNWLSWQDLKWTVDGKEVTGPDLLKRTIFYKVGHHGSHNATLKAKGLEQMENLRVAMIPVDHDMAVEKRWGKMPLDELVTALGKQAKGVVLRVDDKVTPASHENVVADPLFYEVTF